MTEAAVLSDAREQAERVITETLDLAAEVNGLVFDERNGSLKLQFAEGGRLALAVSDAAAAMQLATAWGLGGLQLRLARCGVGVLAVEGLWEGQRFLLTGVPGTLVSRR